MPRTLRTPRRKPARRASLALAGRRRLELSRQRTGDTVEIVDRQGAICVRVLVTAQGVTLSLEGGALTLHSTGTLRVDAERLELRGRSGVSIASDGDAALAVAGDLSMTARSQALTATLGDVRLKANDDVALDGERILLNSPGAGPT